VTNASAITHGIVCAGALTHPDLRALGVERVPLLRIGGETILERTLRCLRDGGGCERLHVLAGREVPLPDWPGVVQANYTGKLVSDGMALLRQLDGEYVLVAGCDCPQLTPECIAELVERGMALQADFVYPLVNRDIAEARFPGGQRTYRSLREGAFTGGNVFLVRREYALQAEPWITELFARRKNPLAMGQLLGWQFLWLLLTGRAPLTLIEQRVSRALRGKFRALVTDHAEIAVDIDKAADYHYFRSVLDPL
jgi:hypothetical protein